MSLLYYIDCKSMISNFDEILFLIEIKCFTSEFELMIKSSEVDGNLLV